MGALVCATLFSCAFARPAYAYIDPSVMTYTIQAVAGVAVALGALFGVVFRRSRRVLMRVFHIDENAHKEIDPPVHRLDAQGSPQSDAAHAPLETATSSASSNLQKARARQGGGEPQRLKWPSRFWRALLASAFLVGTLFLVAPAEMVASNTASLVFTLEDVWGPLLVWSAALALACAVAMSLLWGRGFDIVFTLVVALGICCYVQALFLNQSLPAADGSPLDLSQHIGIATVSTVLWVVVIVGFAALSARRRQFGRNVLAAIACALIVVQGAGVASLWLDSANHPIIPEGAQDASAAAASKASVITKEGLYELSPNNNVVIFVLDTFDVVDLNDMLANDPGILDEMTGFTYFHNSCGSSTPTRYGVPFLLTGAWPQADETWDEYLTNRYPSSTLTDDIVDQGYSLYVYTDSPGRGGLEHLAPLAANIRPRDEIRTGATPLQQADVVGTLYQMALYRDLPWVCKGPFWFYTDAVNQAYYNAQDQEGDAQAGERAGSTLPYVVDDAAFYNQLETKRLSVYDDGSQGSVRFIHLLGLHTPYTIDENAERHGSERTTRVQQAKGSMTIVNEYLRQMKELGVYDDATIIITADHGMWPWETTIEKSEADEDMAGGPIMIVKPSQTAEQAAQPYRVSDAKTGHLDYPATVIDAVGGDSSAYGITVFEAEELNDTSRIRYYYWPTHDGVTDFIIYEYAIDGDVADWSAWHRTGAEWEFNRPSSETL